MATAASRMTLQLRYQRRLRADDYFLLFATLSLTVETVLTYLVLPTLYTSQAKALNLNADPKNIQLDLTPFRIIYALPTLGWTTIFCVKLAYLWFFRLLIDRLRSLTIYWRVVVAVTFISYPLCASSAYMNCPGAAHDSSEWGHSLLETLHPAYCWKM